MANEWQYGDISEFRMRAKAVMRRNFSEISEVLKNWSKDSIAKISHYRALKAVYSEYYLYGHWDNRTSQYKINEDLTIIRLSAKSLQFHISNLSPAACFALRRAADADRQIDFDLDAPHHGWTEKDALAPEQVIEAIKTLRRWANAALREAPETSLGKPPRHAPVRVTRLLAGLYGQLTGLEPYRRENPTDGGQERGHFRRFVNEVMAFVDVEVNDATVRQAKRQAMAEKGSG